MVVTGGLLRDGIMVPVLMGLTSVFAGFVVFSTVGFMSYTIGRPVPEVVEQGQSIISAHLFSPLMWRVQVRAWRSSCTRRW